MHDPQPWPFLHSKDPEYIRQNAHSLPKLNNKECIVTYAGRLVGLSSVLLVSANVTMEDQLSFDQSNKRSSLLFNASTISEAIYWRMNSDWMCNKWNVPNRVSCTPKTMGPPYEDTWTLVRFRFDNNLRDVWTKVDHCLLRDDLRNMDDKFMLRISKVLLIIVAALNMVKCICIALTVRLHNQISIDPRYSECSKGDAAFFIFSVPSLQIFRPIDGSVRPAALFHLSKRICGSNSRLLA